MNYQQKSKAGLTQRILKLYQYYPSLQDDDYTYSPNPQDDLIAEQEFIEENFNDEDFQTTRSFFNVKNDMII